MTYPRLVDPGNKPHRYSGAELRALTAGQVAAHKAWREAQAKPEKAKPLAILVAMLLLFLGSTFAGGIAAEVCTVVLGLLCVYVFCTAPRAEEHGRVVGRR